MAEPITNVLGTVAIKHCGEYDATVNYEKLNVVSYDGSSYCAKGPTRGNLPTDEDFWELMAEKGDKGDTGEEGYTPIKGTDYYTASDKAELEATLSNDVTTEVTSQLSDLTSATPLAAASTAQMSDTTRIYVNTTDGHWYWYDGDSWEDGGVYQSTGIGEKTIFVQDFESNTQNRITDYIDYRELSYSDIIGHFSNASGTEGTTASFAYTILDVKPKDIVIIDDYILTTSGAPCYNLLNNTTLVSNGPLMNTFEDNHYQTTITIPNGVNKIAINYMATYNHSILVKNVVNAIENKNDINDISYILSKYTDITPSDSGTGYIGVSLTYFTYTINSSSTGYKWKKYDVSNIDKAIINYLPRTDATIYGIIYIDTNDKVISVSDYQANMNNEEVKKLIYPPSDAVYMFIQTAANNKLELLNREYITQEDILNQNPIYDKYNLKQVERRCTNLEKQNPFAWKPFDKAYFVFVNDDTNSFFPKALEIFNNENVPLSSAAIVERLNNVYTQYTPDNTYTVKQLLHSLEASGGEVLSHYAGNLAPDGTPDVGDVHYLTTEADWLSKTRDVKMALENEGYNVRGIILADRSKANTSTGQKYCSLYFDYSDRMGTSLNFNLGRRKFFSDEDVLTMAGFKTYIDTCCQTPGFYPFCFHGPGDSELVNEEDLTEILQYIKSKGSSVCECTTYSNVFDTFGSTELEQRISAIEQ